MMKKNIIHLALVSIVTATVAPALVWAQTWAEPNCDPSSDPASCNTAAPLNVSTSAQTKTGPLTVSGALTGGNTLTVSGATNLGSTLAVTGTSTLGTLVVGGTGSTFSSPALFNNTVTISGGSSALTYSGSVANLSFTANSIEDADVSDTLTASIFKGIGSTSNAVDLNSAEFNTTGEQWVNTTGDTMTGTLTITPSSAVRGLTITPASSQEAINITGTTTQPLIYLSPSASTGSGLTIAMGATSSGNGVGVTISSSATGAALSISSATTTTTSYPVVINSTGSAQRSVYATNNATNGYTIYAQSMLSGSVGVAGVGVEQGIYGYASASNTTSKGVYGYGVNAYGGYFATNGTGSTALYAENINAATTSASVAVRGVGKNGYGGYFTASGNTSTALYAANSSTAFGGVNYAIYAKTASSSSAIAVHAESDYGLAGQFMATNGGNGINVSTDNGKAIQAITTEATATGVSVSAAGSSGITISNTASTDDNIGLEINNYAQAVELNNGSIHSGAGFYGGQFFPRSSTSQELFSNIYPSLIETVTLTSPPSLLYTNGLVFDGSDVWVASIYTVSAPGSNAVQRLNAYNANESVQYSPSFLLGWSPGAIVYAGSKMYAFSSTSSSDEYMRMYSFSDSTSSGTLPTALSVRSGVYDGEKIWLGTTNSIYTFDDSSSTLTLVKSGTGQIVDLMFANGYIWALDSDNGRLYKMNQSSGSTVSTITVGSTPNDMEFDGAYFWVSNDDTGTLTRITASNGSTAEIIVGTGSYAGPITFDGVRLWAVVNGNTLYGYNVATGEVEGSVTLTASSYNDAIFDGSYVWVANESNVEKVAVGRGHGYGMPAYPRGIIMYGEDNQYHCIYFDSTGTLNDNTILTPCS